MYRDNTLIPSEAVRLLALGTLAMQPTSYAALASSVRDFTGHIVGPSLDLIGAPIELLKVEGLVEAIDQGGDPEQAMLTVTDRGRDELQTFLSANLRAPVTDINKLILAVKLRFLHLLPAPQQRLQAAMLAEMCERELVRLTQLRAKHQGSPGYFVAWLDHDIAEVTARLAWFHDLCARAPADEP